MENMELLEEQVVKTTNETINKFYQLSIPKEHSGRIHRFPACHIIQPSKINLSDSYQSGILQFSPRNQPKQCSNVFRKISPHGNGTPRSRAR